MAKFGEGAISTGLSRFIDILIIGILTLVCSIPLITMGAAITAAYDVYIRMALDKDSHSVSAYFKAFGKNFGKSTLIHIIMLLGAAFVGASAYVFISGVLEIGEGMRTVGLVLTIVLGLVVAMTFLYVYALQARFENSIVRTIINAFFIALAQFPKTFAMLVANAVFAVLCVLMYGLAPLWLVIVFSLVYYFSAKGMVKAFGLYGDKEAAGEQVEEEVAEETEEAEEAIKESEEEAASDEQESE